MMDELRNYLRENGFDATAQTAIIARFHQYKLLKSDLFSQEGCVCSKLAFVERGWFQFFCNRNGDELTTYTAGPGDYLVSLSSFLKQQPARESIRALTNSTIWVIPQPAFVQLRQDLPAFESFYVALLEDQINCIEESRYNLLTLTAEQRYQKLMAEEPHLLQEVPLHYLASILGVTPRHLSRIRGQIR